MSEHSTVMELIIDSGKDSAAGKFSVTLQIKAKHTDLHNATKAWGSATRLAEELGINCEELSDWIYLRKRPSFVTGRRWSKPDQKKHLESVLFKHTGKTLEELWPNEVFTEDFLALPKTSEFVTTADARGLALYRTELATLPSPGADMERQELKEAINGSLKFLTKREQHIVVHHLGLDGGTPQTLEILSKRWKVSRERIRQIFEAALLEIRSNIANGHLPALAAYSDD